MGISALYKNSIHIQVESWLAQQIPSSLKLLKSTNFYEQKFLKYPLKAQFHSLAELYFAALLEADTEVSHFVPQPFRFRLGSSWYIPDIFYIKNGEKYIHELKSPSGIEDDRWALLEQYCIENDHYFKLTPNQEIYDQETLAINWLTIVKALLSNQHLDTTRQESEIFDIYGVESSFVFGDLVDKGNRHGTYQYEIAIFRLLHRGRFSADLSSAPLCYDTVIETHL